MHNDLCALLAPGCTGRGDDGFKPDLLRRSHFPLLPEAPANCKIPDCAARTKASPEIVWDASSPEPASSAHADALLDTRRSPAANLPLYGESSRNAEESKGLQEIASPDSGTCYNKNRPLVPVGEPAFATEVSAVLFSQANLSNCLTSRGTIT
jgi:hypothetical protein